MFCQHVTAVFGFARKYVGVVGPFVSLEGDTTIRVREIIVYVILGVYYYLMKRRLGKHVWAIIPVVHFDR